MTIMATWHKYVQKTGTVPEWPYPINYSKVNEINTDVMMPNPEKKKPPIVVYPEECWFCGGCVEECPRDGAITMLHPTQQRISVNWKRKDTGEYFRLGMKNPPPPNTRPPSG